MELSYWTHVCGRQHRQELTRTRDRGIRVALESMASLDIKLEAPTNPSRGTPQE
jgi:hypothetical protein